MRFHCTTDESYTTKNHQRTTNCDTESMEARQHQISRDRACRRQRLPSETPEDREIGLFRRRAHDQASRRQQNSTNAVGSLPLAKMHSIHVLVISCVCLRVL